MSDFLCAFIGALGGVLLWCFVCQLASPKRKEFYRDGETDFPRARSRFNRAAQRLGFLALFITVTASAAPTPEISKADILKTLAHMQQLAKESEENADQLTVANDKLTVENKALAADLAAAQTATTTAQQKVDAVTAWGNEQATEKDAALDKVDAQAKQLAKDVTHINHLKLFIDGLAVALVFMVLLRLNVGIIPMYGPFILWGGPAAAGVALWFLL